VIDDGAVEKLTSGGKSLLPIGVVGVQGAFARGEVIACVSAAGREVARGLTNYSSAEAKLIQRRSSTDIESVLGYMLEPELIHRDNLVLV
jgi:glutamate 5-kinase